MAEGLLTKVKAVILDSVGVAVDPAIKSKQPPYSSVGTGAKTVTTAGTRVQLDSATCKRVFIQAHEENAGTIVVGGSSVVATLGTREGFAFYATQGDWFNVDNTNLLYIDSTVNGEKINYYYEN